MSDTAAAKRLSRGEKGENILDVTGKADLFLSARIICVIEGKEGKITNIDYGTIGVD